MKSTNQKKSSMKKKEVKTSDLQKLYSERIERFMALVELSYALKTAPRITHTK